MLAAFSAALMVAASSYDRHPLVVVTLVPPPTTPHVVYVQRIVMVTPTATGTPTTIPWTKTWVAEQTVTAVARTVVAASLESPDLP